MTQKFYLSFFIIATITIACNSSEAKRHKRLQSVSCPSRLSGNWDFGTAPYGCGVPASVSAPLQSQYQEQIFDDTAQAKTERPRYMEQMYKIISDAATAYLQRREPTASANDIEKWVQLNLAVAHQESYWSHYRIGRDQHFRFFKGDQDHGFGMMQIDERSHNAFVKSGKIYDLRSHLVYAMDIMYQSRQKNISNPCTTSSSIDDINRSVYSAYNGGPGSRCRWTNSKHTWAKNDHDFWAKYQNRSWEKVISTVAKN